MEEASLVWPQTGGGGGGAPGLEAVEALLLRPNGSDLIRAVEDLHPTRSDVIAGELYGDGDEQIGPMMRLVRSAHGSDPLLGRILTLASESGLVNSDGSAMTDADVHRIVLAMRYNGFESGLYLRYSLFNHSDDPNCVKFLPEDRLRRGLSPGGGELGGEDEGEGGSPGSEVWTTRSVRRGEALTIHYLNPREVCHATCRSRLWDQHRFDIGDDVVEDGTAIRSMELVGGEIPPSSRISRWGGEDGGGAAEEGAPPRPPTYYVERALSDLEGLLSDVTAATISSGGGGDARSFQQAAEIELTSYELITAAEEKLGNPEHVLMIRCRRLHLDACVAVLSMTDVVTQSQSVHVMCRFVPNARSLLALQILCVGEHHPDVARTYHDLAEGVGTLLARAPKKLTGIRLEGMETFVDCAREENRCRRECRRIDALYPRRHRRQANVGGSIERGASSAANSK